MCFYFQPLDWVNWAMRDSSMRGTQAKYKMVSDSLSDSGCTKSTKTAPISVKRLVWAAHSGSPISVGMLRTLWAMVFGSKDMVMPLTHFKTMHVTKTTTSWEHRLLASWYKMNWLFGVCSLRGNNCKQETDTLQQSTNGKRHTRNYALFNQLLAMLLCVSMVCLPEDTKTKQAFAYFGAFGSHSGLDRPKCF